jgi:hypothetical protein
MTAPLLLSATLARWVVFPTGQEQKHRFDMTVKVPLPRKQGIR